MAPLVLLCMDLEGPSMGTALRLRVPAHCDFSEAAPPLGIKDASISQTKHGTQLPFQLQQRKREEMVWSCGEPQGGERGRFASGSSPPLVQAVRGY